MHQHLEALVAVTVARQCRTAGTAEKAPARIWLELCPPVASVPHVSLNPPFQSFPSRLVVWVPGNAAALTTVGCGHVVIIALGLIRFCGHLPKGGYDVQTDGRASHEPASAPAIR
jgi:hypothetical protein